MAGLLGFGPTKQRTCALCGKTFGAGEEYVYKLAKPHTGTAFDWYCGYTCFRVAQKPREEARKAHRAEMERRAQARAEKTLETKRRREEEKARLKAACRSAGERNGRTNDCADEKGERGKKERAMKATPDELKHYVSICAKGMCSKQCPYYERESCVETMMVDALAYIEQLEAEREEKKRE